MEKLCPNKKLHRRQTSWLTATTFLLATSPSWGVPFSVPGQPAIDPGPCNPILAPRPPLDTLKFTGSDSSRMAWLSDMLYTFLDADRHEGGSILAANHAYIVADVQARGLLPIGSIGSTDIIGGLSFLLQVAPLEEDGYVWSSINEPVWPFPNATDSNGVLKRWLFETAGNAEGWTSSGFSSSNVSGGSWNLLLDGSDPQLISPALSVSANDMPFVSLRMLCKDGMARCSTPVGSSANYGQIFWKTNVNPSFNATRSMFFRIPNADEFIPGWPVISNMHVIPVYQSPEWKDTITGIRIDPVGDGQPGRTLIVDGIEGAYDSRQQVTNAYYILALAQYYFATGDDVVFTSAFPPHGTAFDRARKAMNFIESAPFGLHGRANDFTLVDWKGHDGRAGIIGTTIQYGKGIAGTSYDILPVGYKDAYSSVYYYAALEALALLEDEAQAHPEWGVAANPYGQTGASYASQAADVKVAIDSQFWIDSKGRLMACRDADNVIQDPGHVGLNVEAAYFNAISEPQAAEMLEWLSGDRTVSGDLSTGTDIYFWQATPRLTTKDVSAWYSWPMYVWFGVDLNAFPGAHFGEQVQNGGGWFWLSFYDVVSRVKIRGADDGWERMKAIIDWYRDTQNEGGFGCYYKSRDIVKQGCRGAGAIGIDCEFIDSTLVPLAALYGFLGYETNRDGLIFRPRIPTESPRMGVERLFFRNHYYNVEGSRDLSAPLRLLTTPGTGNTAHSLPLRVDGLLANHPYRVLVTNLATSVTSVVSMTSDGAGTIKGSFSIPASGKLEIVSSSQIFADGFESGDLSKWI